MAEPRAQADYRAHDREPLALVAQRETGARPPAGGAGKVLLWVAIAWSLFQLWYASPLPFVFNFFVLNDTEARAIHLAFAIFLTFTAYPALKSSPRDHVPLQDWALALLGAFAAGYLYLFYDALADRPGRPTGYDLVVAVVGMVLLLEATRRALGPPLMVVALVFLAYVFLGPYAPDVLAYQGASVPKKMNKLGSAGHPVPGSTWSPDPVEATVALENARKKAHASEEISAEDKAGELAGKPSDPKA